jgi:flagellar basal-body rod protein FlgG
MNHAFEIAGVGLGAQQRALDVIANNIANVNTPGFKRSDVRFVELIASVHDTMNPGVQLGAAPSLAGVSARPSVMIDAQGEIERTGRALDIAIQGEGFIEIMGPRGQLARRLAHHPRGRLTRHRRWLAASINDHGAA